MKNANYAAGYAVVGINTWKAFYRQNTNFAIPAKVIKNFIFNLKILLNQEKFADYRGLLDQLVISNISN